MVGKIIAGFRMYQYIQSLTIEHQPRDYFRKILGREYYLIHGNRVRANSIVMPAPQDYVEMFIQLLANYCGSFLVLLTIIDMGVIASDRLLCILGHFMHPLRIRWPCRTVPC